MKDGRRFGRPPDPYTPPETPEGRINITDPDSRVVKRPARVCPGLQRAGRHQRAPDRLGRRGHDRRPGLRSPRADARRHPARARRGGVTDRPGVLLADAGYWHQEQMESIVADGIQVLIPPDASKRKAPRRGWTGGLYAFMRRVLASERRRRALPPAPADDRARLRPDRSSTAASTASDAAARAAVRTEWRLHHRHPQPPGMKLRGEGSGGGVRARS